MIWIRQKNRSTKNYFKEVSTSHLVMSSCRVRYFSSLLDPNEPLQRVHSYTTISFNKQRHQSYEIIGLHEGLLSETCRLAYLRPRNLWKSFWENVYPHFDNSKWCYVELFSWRWGDSRVVHGKGNESYHKSGVTNHFYESNPDKLESDVEKGEVKEIIEIRNRLWRISEYDTKTGVFLHA